MAVRMTLLEQVIKKESCSSVSKSDSVTPSLTALNLPPSQNHSSEKPNSSSVNSDKVPEDSEIKINDEVVSDVDVSAL